ncbi:hypothetical protein AWV80_38775 [Cupriavidus sp. UYMU48A]|nr:hypothetical protein AWV80_38775 [Cupriavidus sp. UYMU48A]
MKGIIKGTKYKVLGTTDYPNCDCCGKTNLTRAVGLESADGQVLNVGVICASKLLRQNYMGKTYKASADAILSMGKRVKREDAIIFLTAA